MIEWQTKLVELSNAKDKVHASEGGEGPSFVVGAKKGIKREPH